MTKNIASESGATSKPRAKSFVDKEKKMEVKQRKNKGKLIAAILFTGCFILTTAYLSTAQTKAPIQIDFSKIKPAADMKKALSDGMSGMPGMKTGSGQMPVKTAPSKAKTTSTASGTTGTMNQAIADTMGNTMQDSFMNSNMMAEMQKKVMAENMKTIQASVMESVLKSMQGVPMTPPQGTKNAQ